MNDVEELRVFAAVHARAQRVPDRVQRDVLARVTHDGEGPGSWTAEWSAAARGQSERGRPLLAARLYTMARFPYVDGPGRQRALELSVAEFRRWRADRNVDLQELTLAVDGGSVTCWASGFTARETRPKGPFVVLMGGIVSTKEQWAPVLLRMRRFGISGIVTDMPRAGASTVPYDDGSWRFLSGLLDALDGRADTSRTFAMMLSFSGHLALRCALDDPRVRGVATVGAPVHGAFADPAWQRGLPRITLATLAHLTGTTVDAVGEHLRERALTPGQLTALDIPVAYVASRQDEIIPAADIDLLRRHVRRLDLLEHDDVHGSPRHVAVTGPWLLRSVLRMHGARTARRALLGPSVALLRAGHRVAGRLPHPAGAIGAAPTTAGTTSQDEETR